MPLYKIQITNYNGETMYFEGFSCTGEVIHSGEPLMFFTRKQAFRCKKMLLTQPWVDNVDIIEREGNGFIGLSLGSAINTINNINIDTKRENEKIYEKEEC